MTHWNQRRWDHVVASPLLGVLLWRSVRVYTLYFCFSVTKSCRSCASSNSSPVSPSLWLYGVLTKTLHTAQAHFAVRHASVKHKNKLTENAKAALYPRDPFQPKENKRNPDFPLFHSAFYGRSLVKDKGNNTVCLFDPCLIYQAPRRITVRIQRCEATKFVGFRRSSVVG